MRAGGGTDGISIPASVERSPVGERPPLSGRRILIVLESLELGGAERQALLLARYLAHQQRARTEVWGLGASGAAQEICGREGIASRRMPLRFTGGWLALPILIRRFARELRRAGPEVILPYTLVPNVVCAASAPMSG